MKERIICIIRKLTSLPGYLVTDRSNLQKDLGLDMIDLFYLVLMLEKEFAMYISDEDSSLFNTVGEVQEYIGKRLEQHAVMDLPSR